MYECAGCTVSVMNGSVSGSSAAYAAAAAVDGASSSSTTGTHHGEAAALSVAAADWLSNSRVTRCTHRGPNFASYTLAATAFMKGSAPNVSTCARSATGREASVEERKAMS